MCPAWVASALTKPNPERKEQHTFPTFLPDGQHFLYHRMSGIPQNNGVCVGSLDSKAEEQGSKQVMATNVGAVYVSPQGSHPGYLLFLREQTPMALCKRFFLLFISGNPRYLRLVLPIQFYCRRDICGNCSLRLPHIARRPTVDCRRTFRGLIKAEARARPKIGRRSSRPR